MLSKKRLELNIAIFASHNGSVLESLLDAGFNVKLIITNNSDAPVIQKAHRNGIACEVVNERLYPNKVTQTILNKLEAYDIDLIILAGYMKMLPKELVKRYRNRIVNSHPSLLPKFGGAGMYGRRVHEAVVAAGERESGVSVHYVEEEYDSGEIILQKSLEVDPLWDAALLEAAVKEIEPAAVIEALRKIENDRS